MKTEQKQLNTELNNGILLNKHITQQHANQVLWCGTDV